MIGDWKKKYARNNELWLHCWQKTYQTLHPLAFPNISVAVVVYNLLSPGVVNELSPHINNIVCRAWSIPVVLVGTHLDKLGGDFTLPLPQLKMCFPQVLFPAGIISAGTWVFF